MSDDGERSDGRAAEDDRVGVDAYVGTTIAGRYRLDAVLRTSGWASSDRAWFAARDLEHDRALGVRVDRVVRPSTFERRVAIARAASAQGHPGIERVEAHGAIEERVRWVAGELLLGGTLREHLEAEGGVLPWRDALSLLAPSIDALGAAHRAGLLHGDLELDRVFLARGGRVVITEFGDNARLGGDELSWVPSRPEVIAPEEARRGGDVDARTEIYRVGAMLYELVTGAPPYGGRNAAATLHAIVRAELDPPSRYAAIPPALESAIRRAMARAPLARFASMRELGEALASL